MEADTFVVLNFAVLTISDTRTEATDKSGRVLAEGLQVAGHRLVTKAIVPDNIYQIRAIVSTWIAEDTIQAILTTGGTGVTGRDRTPEALQPLFDKEIPGFGEIFRMVSFAEIGTATLQSRAIAGVANGTYIFCLPGSTGACRTGWNKLLKDQFDACHKPCNFAELFSRLQEV